MANMKAYISKHNKNTLLKAHRKHLDIQLGNLQINNSVVLTY